jgi:hypothetical protein
MPEIAKKIIELGEKKIITPKIKLINSRRVLVQRKEGGLEEFVVREDLASQTIHLKKVGVGCLPTIFLRENSDGELEIVQDGHMILNETCVEA